MIEVIRLTLVIHGCIDITIPAVLYRSHVPLAVRHVACAVSLSGILCLFNRCGETNLLQEWVDPWGRLLLPDKIHDTGLGRRKGGL